MLAPWKKSYDKTRQHIKKQRHHFAKNVCVSQSYGFSSSHVQMWQLDRKEGWALKNWCFWTLVLEKTFFFFFFTLKYCIGFAIHQHESATDIHVSPILNPPFSSLPVPSLWVISVYQPQASSIMHWTWTGDSFDIWYYTCFNAIQESLGLQGDQISKSLRKSTLNIHVGTDAEAEAPILWPPDKSQLIRKDPDAGKDWGQEEKGPTEDEIFGWHHWLNGHEF